MVISVLAAFSLARMGFWGSQTLATGVFLTYLIPNSLLFIPLFQIVGGLGLINNVWCLLVVYPTLAVPFCTWIMIGYFASIPKELDEAALIDGAGYLQMLWRISSPSRCRASSPRRSSPSPYAGASSSIRWRISTPATRWC